MIEVGLVAGLVLMAIGTIGVARAFPAVRAREPNTPMTYPVGLPWLVTRPTSARTVLRIGQLYAATGLLVALYAIAALSEQQSTRQIENCRNVADQIVRMQRSDTVFVATLQHEHPDGSECAVRATDGAVWYSVRTERRNDAIGEAFNTQARALERLGMGLEHLTIGGRRAAVGVAGSGTDHEPRILIQAETAIHTVVVRHPAAGSADFDRLLSAFRRQ